MNLLYYSKVSKSYFISFCGLSIEKGFAFLERRNKNGLKLLLTVKIGKSSNHKLP